ncbi:energy-coupling factor ABC transporter ATP-binding protein [Angustibacter sp. Root456]|uniref:energy-coupling factor ABC transporter ATP-binding protein n=1 Tax=Angustibacter sp. Root456 TaxID=1736539 RepID=UPI0006FB4A0C|nr:ABC transporter ATP-binding protein [Angustibacter sp. Root456]KQX66598.1 cobalt ABC transporter ATP-binding protein [Angustibacter sp. Root456]
MIRLSGVQHAYGDTVVLDGIDLALTEQRIGVVGANGSGKSTLARLLNGLVLPSSGSVTVDGLDTRRDGAAVRRQVGFVFTDPDAQIVMPTVAEDIQFSLRRKQLSRGERQALVADALERYGLSGLGDRPAHLLSGGQKQLLALAAVLVTEPSVLVCDEPTTLLDLRNSLRVAELIAALPQQVVMVTHQLELLADYDRVIVVDQARVAFDGAPAEAISCYRGLMQAAGR